MGSCQEIYQTIKNKQKDAMWFQDEINGQKFSIFEGKD